MLPETATECPAERMRLVVVPVPSKLLDARSEHFSTAKLPVLNDPSLENGKPDFYLVYPGGMLGREDELEPSSVPLVESVPCFPPVNVEVVPNDKDLSLGVSLRDRLHEFVQVFGRSPTAALTEHFSIANVEGSKQSHRPMPFVFKFIPPGRAWLRVDDGMLASQSLNARLFIDA